MNGFKNQIRLNQKSGTLQKVFKSEKDTHKSTIRKHYHPNVFSPVYFYNF